MQVNRPEGYMRDQLLSLQPATLDPSLIARLRELGIGCPLPQTRSCRDDQRKQRRIPVICGTAARGSELRTSPENTSSRITPLTRSLPPVAPTNTTTSTKLKVCLFKARPVRTRDKGAAFNHSLCDGDIDVVFLSHRHGLDLTETKPSEQTSLHLVTS